MDRIKGVLDLFSELPEEIILHYAYQIPENTADIIGAHDQVKSEANELLNDVSFQVKNELGIDAKVSLVFGSLKNTLKRVLLIQHIDAVVSSQKYFKRELDSSIKEEFNNVSFIFTDGNVGDVAPVDPLNYLSLNGKVSALFDLEQVERSIKEGHSIMFFEKYNAASPNRSETIIIL